MPNSSSPQNIKTFRLDIGTNGSSGVSAASGLLGKPGTYRRSPGSWDAGYLPLPKTEKSPNLAHYFPGRAKFLVKKSNIELQSVNIRRELAFYWGNSTVNIRVQTPGGKASPLSLVVDTPMYDSQAKAGNETIDLKARRRAKKKATGAERMRPQWQKISDFASDLRVTSCFRVSHRQITFPNERINHGQFSIPTRSNRRYVYMCH